MERLRSRSSDFLASEEILLSYRNGSTPSLSRSSPDTQHYTQGYREGYNQGYRDGIRSCLQQRYSYQQSQIPYGAQRPNPYIRGYRDGYAQGFERGIRSCSNYSHDHDYGHGHNYNHDHDNHGNDEDLFGMLWLASAQHLQKAPRF